MLIDTIDTYRISYNGHTLHRCKLLSLLGCLWVPYCGS